MAYAQPSDMIARFGSIEMLRLSAPEGEPLDVIDQDRVNTALGDASALIDSYLRRRYATPLAAVPQEVLRACCILARFDLAHGNGREPSEQMRLARKETITWLESIRAGQTFLADATPSGEESMAQVKVRDGSPYGGIGAVPSDATDPNAGWPYPTFGSGLV